MPAGYAVVIREKPATLRSWTATRKSFRPVFRSILLLFSQYMAVLKSRKAPKARTSLLSNSPATKRRRLGITARSIRRHVNIVSKGEIIAVTEKLFSCSAPSKASTNFAPTYASGCKREGFFASRRSCNNFHHAGKKAVTTMKSLLSALFGIVLLMASLPAWSQVATGSLDAHWNEGAKDCKANPQAPIEVHAYNPQTFILRENLCSTFEAPFMYLLIGSKKALLIDTGDVADPNQMPLAKTVMHLLPGDGPATLPLLVVHTHRHLDHRAGDGQFMNLPDVQVVGWDLDSVQRYYNFTNWPNDLAQINLGDRTVDVIPTPGHNATHVSFYDRNTGLFFSGDFLMPGRLLIDDANADLASARRVAAFVKDRPVSYVLGGHIELDAAGEAFPWESQYHPHEHALQMSKDDLLALPAAISTFNGFYTRSGGFILINSMHMLIAFAIVAGVAVIALVLALVLYIRRRRAHKQLAVSAE